MRISFADCILDTDRHELLRHGSPIEIEPQVFDLVSLLARNPGRLISKEELQEEIWGGVFVSDSAISAQITALRKAVGDNGKEQRVVRTVPRRGIQMVAPVSPAETPIHPPTLGPRLERPAIRYAKAPDGAQIADTVTGSGPPVIRTAHFQTDLEMGWEEPSMFASLCVMVQHHTVIRYDQRGCGMSDRGLEALSFEQSALDLIAVADAAGLNRFAIMGQSNGTRIAVHAAIHAPDRITQLILQAGYVDGRLLRGVDQDPIKTMIGQRWAQNNQAFIRAYIMMYFPDAPSDWVHDVALTVQNATSRDDELMARDFGNTTSIGDVLCKVSVPTLVVHSRDDAVHPLSEARKMTAGISGSELVVLNSPNHYVLPHESDWQLYLDRILEFLARP
ncbi:MAG: alpha/beta fold hydrolase [Paracoccaceae bacterium]